MIRKSNIQKRTTEHLLIMHVTQLYIKIQNQQNNIQDLYQILHNLYMGNSNYNDYADRNKYDISSWTPIQTNQIYKVVRDKNGLLAQEYDLITQQKLDEMRQLQIYDFRRIQNELIVKVYGVNFINSSSISNCCNKKYHRKVLIQRIPHRLSMINKLTFNEALYTLVQSFKGYYQISKKLNNSLISANMIGITPEGFIKVWINDNWAENHPDLNSTKTAPTGNYTEEKTIVNLIHIIQSHMQGGRFPESFNDWLDTYPESLKKFTTAQNTIKAYCLQNNIIISDHINVEKGQIIQSVTPIRTTTTRINQSNRNLSVKFNYLSSNSNIIRSPNQQVLASNQYRI